jgi:hypothetical protein
MALTVIIDDPPDLQLAHPVCRIKGWCSSDQAEDLRGLDFRIGGSRVPSSSFMRPDVQEACPDKASAGFFVHLDLSFYMHVVRDRGFTLQVITARLAPVDLHFRVSAGAIGSCLEAAGGV